jgi:hypothetical protein
MGWRRLSISPAGVAAFDKHSRMEVNWLGIERIAFTEGHVFLYNSDWTALIVPQRCFDSDEEFHQFLATARRFRRDARDASEAEPDSGRGPGDSGIRAGTRDDR